MRLFAALLAATSVYLAVGYLIGYAPVLRWRVATDRPKISNQALWLTQAGAQLGPSQFLAWSMLLGIAAFAVAVAVTGVPWVSLPPAVACTALPRWHYGRRRIRRLAEVLEAWPDGLRHIVASLRSGMSLTVALEELSRSGPEPLRRAFSRFASLSRTIGVEAALGAIREEIADPTTDRVIEILLVAYERGGSMVTEVLADLATATAQDLRTVEEIRTAALEQRINGRIVFVVPWVVLLMLTSQAGAFRDFYASAAGLLVVVVGAVMSVGGSWLVARLSSDEIEPRVFGSSATYRGGPEW